MTKKRVFAIADLHLSFSDPSKSMDLFGKAWENHTEKVQRFWKEMITEDDLVLIAGDISWAMRIEQALPDLNWIDQLPGTKVMIRGNHDYWWTSRNKVRKNLASSLHIIHNDAFSWGPCSIGGARLWDTPEFGFDDVIIMKENPKEKVREEQAPEVQAKIFERELNRLEQSLSQVDQDAAVKIAMTHYPPCGGDLHSSLATKILEKYNIDLCVFGHLHNVTEGALPYGTARGVEYVLTSCDYIHCKPLLVWEE